MLVLIRLFNLAFVFGTFATIAQTATGKEAVLHIKHTVDFQVVGDGATTPWQTTEWVSLPQREGTASYTTQVKMLYSNKGIYALFDCTDKKITASKEENFRDLWRQDVIEIFLWTDETMPLYFEYQLSPLNHELALLVPNFEGDFLGWMPWKYEGERKAQHAVKILKEGKQDIVSWRGELFIPYALLKPLRNVPPKKGSFWRMNLSRLDYDNPAAPSAWTWQPVKTNLHEYTSYGTIVFD